MTTPGPAAIVLGTAQDGGVPQAGCRCDTCQAARRDRSLSRCVASLGIVSREGQGYLIDATPDLPEQLDRLPGLHGLLLTHAHMGHCSGLLYLGKEVMAVRRLPVWMGPRLFEHLEDNEPWASLLNAGYLVPNFVISQKPIPIGAEITVHGIPVQHRGEWSETFAYRVKGPNRALLWCPDIDEFDVPALAALLDEVDTAFLDGTFWNRNEIPYRNIDEVPHPTVTDTLDLLEKVRPKAKITFTHLNHTNPLWNRESREFRELVARYEKLGLSHEGETPVAEEGFVVPL